MILLHKQTWNRKHARIVRPLSGRQCSVYLILAEYRWGAKYFLLIQGSVKVAAVTSGWRSKILFEENGQGLKILFPAFPICTLDWGSHWPPDSFFSQVSTVSPKVRRLNCGTTTPILMMMKRKRYSRIRETRRPQSIVRLSRSMERRTSNSSEC